MLSLGPDYPPVATCEDCCAEILVGEGCRSCEATFDAERLLLDAVEVENGPPSARTVTVRFTVVRTATDRTYTTNEVVAMTGLSYRQVDYWIRRGVLGDSGLSGLGSGGRRQFSGSDVDVLRAIALYVRTVRPNGTSSTAIVDDAAAIEAAVRDAAPGGWLVVTSDEAAVVHDAADLVELIGGGAVVVPLPDLDEIPEVEPDLLTLAESWS